jgi:hypothetical protein
MVRLNNAGVGKSEGGAADRISLILIGFNVIFNSAKVFFVGTGAGNFPHGVIIHNMWVRLFAEHGIFALLSMIALFLSFFRTIIKVRSSGAEESGLWVIYLTASLIPFLLISSQVYHTAGHYEVLFPLLVIISFVVSRQRIAEKTTVVASGIVNHEAPSVAQSDRILRRRPRLQQKS